MATADVFVPDKTSLEGRRWRALRARISQRHINIQHIDDFMYRGQGAALGGSKFVRAVRNHPSLIADTRRLFDFGAGTAESPADGACARTHHREPGAARKP